MTRDHALADLRREFARHGWTRKATTRILWELAIHVSLFAGGSVLFLTAPGILWKLLGAVMAALGGVGIASNSHTSSHFGTARKSVVNRFLTHFGYAFCLGFPAVFWWDDHVKGHHAGPNVVGIDDDFDYLPLFATDAVSRAEATGFRRWYYQHCQWIVIYFVIPLMTFNLQRRGVSYLVQQVRANSHRWKTYLPDIVAMCLHVLVFLILPSLIWPVQNVIALYVARMLLTSLGLFVILIPGHFPPEASLLTQEKAETLDHATLQTYTTVNYDGGALVRFFSSGLGYQIEHHLFPEISHCYYPRIAPLVKKYCREYDLQYRQYSLAAGLWVSLKVFRYPKPLES